MWVAVASIVTAGLTLSIGCIFPSIAEGNAVKQTLQSMAQQPDEAANLRSTLFVSLAMLESCCIYSLLIAMILIFSNPFWDYAAALAR
jgi:F-type H+-transporting ATPase subunit c